MYLNKFLGYTFVMFTVDAWGFCFQFNSSLKIQDSLTLHPQFSSNFFRAET